MNYSVRSISTHALGQTEIANAPTASGRSFRGRIDPRSSLGLVLLCLMLMAVSGAASWGDDGQSGQGSSVPLKNLSLEQLGSVEVTTASKKPEQVWRTPAAIYVLTQDDIRRSGATSIPEVLRLVPGVEVARVNANVWAVGIRGFGSAFSKSVLVLIDGRSVYTPLFAGVEWNVQNVLLEDVERIEVVRGPGGTIWGSNAVNLITSLRRTPKIPVERSQLRVPIRENSRALPYTR